jgi:hypothetical protein
LPEPAVMRSGAASPAGVTTAAASHSVSTS